MAGVEDEDKGGLPVPYVVPALVSEQSADALIAFCRAHLTAYKVPRHVVFKAEPPLGPTGKILKKVRREWVMSDAMGGRDDFDVPLRGIGLAAATIAEPTPLLLLALGLAGLVMALRITRH